MPEEKPEEKRNDMDSVIDEIDVGIDIPSTPQKPDFIVKIKGNKKIILALVVAYIVGFLSGLGYIYVTG